MDNSYEQNTVPLEMVQTFLLQHRNLTTDSPGDWESLWHLAAVVRELLQNQMLVTCIDSPGTHGQTLSWQDNSSFPLFLNMLSRRESVVFLYLDIGPPAQQMKSMFLKGSVLVVDADPQFTWHFLTAVWLLPTLHNFHRHDKDSNQRLTCPSSTVLIEWCIPAVS